MADEPLEPTEEQATDLKAAIFEAPDVASYTTVTGAQVQRRSVDEILKLERAVREARLRRRRFRQSRVRFG